MNRWDTRFAEATAPGTLPEVLAENCHLLPTSGSALDIACGLGAGALFLAQRGLATSAWDGSAVALQKVNEFARQQGVAITTHQVDLENGSLPAGEFDLITVGHYLHRPLCKKIIERLRPGGLLFYQTWTRRKTSDEGPDNPDFLLESNELLRLFAPLTVVAFREEADWGDLSTGFRNRAYLVARKP